MTTNFPTGLDALTNPTSSNNLNSPSHSGQHANANDAVEALEAKVGIDDSADTASLDYQVAHRLPSAVDIGTDTDVSPFTAENMTVVTLAASDVVLAVKLEGDTYPRWLLFADPDEGLYMGDGTFDAYADGSVIRNDGTNYLHVQSGADWAYIGPAINCLGDIKTAASKGLVLQSSPGDLLYRLKVADDGTLSTEQVLTWP